MDAHHDRIAGSHLNERDGPRRTGHDIHHDAAIHLRPLHGDPAAFQPYERLQIGGGVEVVREHGVGRRRFEAHVVLLHDLHPVLLQVAQDRVQLFLVGRGDPQEGGGLVVFVAAHAKPQDAVLGTVLQDLVEHPREQQRVDDMSFQLYVFVCSHAGQYT